jgi:hypothetical protein
VQRILGLLGVSAAHEVHEPYETMQSALFVGPWLQRLRQIAHLMMMRIK